MSKTKQKIAFAILIAIFLSAFEGVVVSTAAPVIVKSLHNFEMISWIFSLYLLASAVSTPIYGKLADLYGRKRMFIIGILIFLVGSILCGLAQSMLQLVLFRAVQGMGAGAILTIGFTIIGDIFTLEERSIVQGGISTVWGVAGLIGPLLGGFLIDNLSWHWIFFVNIPLCIFCIYILSRYVHEQKPTKHPKIDYLGALLLSIAIGSFLYGVMTISGDFVLGMILFIITTISGIIFYLQETKTPEPIVPLFILNRNSLVVNAVTFGVSFILIANSVYLPLHIQSIMGYSATVAGLSLIGTSAAWFLSSVSLARLMQKFEAKYIVMCACAILIFSCCLINSLHIDSPLWQMAIYVFFFGFGFSGTLNTLTFIVQDSVSYDKRGAAVGINMLTRTLAQTIGVTVLGAVINVYADIFISEHNLSGITMQNFYDNTAPMYYELLREALFFALNHVYLINIAVAAVCFFLAYFVPKYQQQNQ
ncbi:MDR family MFS transporter [Megamonas sp.]